MNESCGNKELGKPEDFLFVVGRSGGGYCSRRFRGTLSAHVVVDAGVSGSECSLRVQRSALRAAALLLHRPAVSLGGGGKRTGGNGMGFFRMELDWKRCGNRVGRCLPP